MGEGFGGLKLSVVIPVSTSSCSTALFYSKLLVTGPLGWLVPSEIFPLEFRSAGQSVNVSVNMFFTFIIAQLFLNMLCHLKFGLFYFFAGFVLIMITFFFPETKNVPIEEMVTVCEKHWFWGKFIPRDAPHV